MADEDLSDEQLHQLLKDAEQRLRNKPQNHGQPRNALSSTLRMSVSRSTSEKLISSYVKSTEHGAHVDRSYLVSDREKLLSNGIRRVQDPVATKSQAVQAKKATAGDSWYNLPRTVITPELKRDLQLLRMRSVLDPKRHYKKEGSRPQIPEFSHVGTIIEGPTEFFSARLSNKNRKRTFVEEVLAAEKVSGRFRNKYGEIQAAKTSGKKEYYKNLKAKRAGGRGSKS